MGETRRFALECVCLSGNEPLLGAILNSPFVKRGAVSLAMAAMLALGASAGPRVKQASSTAHKAASRPAAATTALAAPVKTYGSKSAPITMDVFTDYQCPTCRTFYEQTLRYVINDYVSAGKVYLVHHDFPLVMHPYSGVAARWANAAATVGQFDTIETALYDNQSAWAADGNIAKYVAQAMPSNDFQRVQAIMKPCTTPAPQEKTLGADPLAQSGHACPVDTFIAQDIKTGEAVPVSGTPTYIITYKGRRLAPGSGYVSWPILKQFFDSLLAQ